MIDDKLIDRIKKMQAKAQSALDLGLEHEALAFSSAVQRLLMKHNLEMTDVEAMHEAQTDPVKAHVFDQGQYGLPARKNRVQWTEQLAATVAKAHMCRIVIIEKSNTFFLVGTRQNRQVAELMLVTLLRYALKHSEKDYVKFFYQCRDEGDVTRARGYKAGWLLGFVLRLKERYEAENNLIRIETSQTPEGRYALIRLNNQLTRVTDVVEKISTGKANPLGGRQNASRDGFEDGREHGDRVKIRGTGIEGGAEGQRQLGRGQGLLGR